MLQELFDMLLLKYTRNLLLLGIMDSSLNEHANIFSALEARDSEGLQKALSTHLINVRAHITQGFERMFVARKEPMDDLIVFQQCLIGSRRYFSPHISSAISLMNRSLSHCCSSLRILPSSVEAKPHCGLMHNRLIGI
jgi:hypothetical protein